MKEEMKNRGKSGNPFEQARNKSSWENFNENLHRRDPNLETNEALAIGFLNRMFRVLVFFLAFKITYRLLFGRPQSRKEQEMEAFIRQ